MRKIAFVGQTPPPYGGQAIMIEKILHGNYRDVRLFHIRMSFSKEMDEIGKANVSKIFHLFSVISRIYFTRIFKGATILYYPPAGPDKTPVIRDILILISTRWLFKKTIFHFHAGGVSEMKINSTFFRFLYKWAYYKADCSILLSELNPADGKNLQTKNQVIVPYGIEDNYSGFFQKEEHTGPPKILFVAIIKESKGILVLIEACKILHNNGVDFELEIMGKFESKEFELLVRNNIDASGLNSKIKLLGVLSGKSKFEVFNRSDIFCFPTFFESETFGVVLLEAMQFSLPIVATNWRGIPSVIKNTETGFIVEPKNANALAEKLELLLIDSNLRDKMGKAGREHFLKNYTIIQFQKNMEQVFLAC